MINTYILGSDCIHELDYNKIKVYSITTMMEGLDVAKQ